MRHWRNGAFELVTSAGILAELERTLTKLYYRSRRSPSQIAAVVSLVASEATIVVPTVNISGVTTHPEDDLVLAVAVSANVGYLVTGDKPLHRLGAYQHIHILSPRAVLDLLEFTGDQP